MQSKSAVDFTLQALQDQSPANKVGSVTGQYALAFLFKRHDQHISNCGTFQIKLDYGRDAMVRAFVINDRHVKRLLQCESAILIFSRLYIWVLPLTILLRLTMAIMT